MSFACIGINVMGLSCSAKAKDTATTPSPIASEPYKAPEPFKPSEPMDASPMIAPFIAMLTTQPPPQIFE